MPALEKALITNTVTGAALRVQFSPEEYTVSRDVNYAQAPIPGLSGLYNLLDNRLFRF